MKMELYPDQLQAADDFEGWLLNHTTHLAGLWASAGYGKSYCVKHLINEVVIKNSNYTPVLTSMTHSAVDVLAEFTGMAVNTLHSLMGWVPYVDKDTGEEGISTPKMRDSNADPRLERNMLVVVDEAGLMGHNEVALLKKECKETGARVLLVGDNKQCFPVTKEGEELCIPAYDATECKMHLTEPKRVDKGDVIFALSQAYRRAVDGERQPRLRTLLNADGTGRGIRHVDDIEEFAYKAFEAGVRDGNVRDIKVLAFTNKRCLSLNRKIRKKVMGLKDPVPIVGEEMVANTAITTSTGDNVLIRNNQKLIVKTVEPTTSFGLAGAFIQYLDMDGEDIEETVFVPATPDKLLTRLKQMAYEANQFTSQGDKTEASKKWRAFYSLKEGCADIRFTYAMTVNKSQGTTLKHALVDLCDINSCRDLEQKTRLAYTAVSRATHFVTIEGKLTK